MSVLMDVLKEELDRLQRHREVILRELEIGEGGQKRQELLRQNLPRIAEDMYRIRRALAPVDMSKVDELGFEIQEKKTGNWSECG